MILVTGFYLTHLTLVHISMLIRAAKLRPDLSCLWKLLGDACTAVTTVSPNRAEVLVPALLAGLDPNTQDHILNQAEMLKVGERYGQDYFSCCHVLVHHFYTDDNGECTWLCHRCYAHALKLKPEVASLWHNLGLNYYHQASSLPCLTEKEQDSQALNLEKAQQVVQRIRHNSFPDCWLE